MVKLIGKTIKSYRILEQVGQGGMATVYKARHAENGETVALKILLPMVAQNDTFKARFRREIKVLQELQHPNIVPILDHGEADGFAYIVMPFLAGGSLHERLKAGPVAPQEGARLMAQIASALERAHQAGVVHRDVKPSNVLLDDKGDALLSDFGLAHVVEASVGLTGSALIGTPAYMSPEQCRGEPVDARSDQYSLGVVLYLLATGQLPFEAETPMGIALMHVTDPLPNPRDVNPNLPPSVEPVLLKALAKDPADRFASVGEFNEAFQRALSEALDPSRRGKVLAFRRVARALWPRSRKVRRGERRSDRRRIGVLAAAILLLVACPTAAWALLGSYPGETARPSTGTATPVDLMATVYALSTANAPGAGTVMAPGQLETAVAGTLTAMGSESEEAEPTATSTPTATDDTLAGPSPTPTDQASMPSSDTGGDQESSATATPSPTDAPSLADAPTVTPTPTPTPAPSPTPTPTLTSTPPPPTATSSPTDTPMPSDTPPADKCKDSPHPVFPTCTPSP